MRANHSALVCRRACEAADFADQAAYDAHTSSPAYKELIAGQFADLIVEFVELDHELLVSL